jgi:hypothetical protein
MKPIQTYRALTLLSGMFFTACLALMLAGRTTALAQATPAEHDHNHEAAMTVAGTLRCTSCDLKRTQHAHAQCSVYGCQFAFKADNVTNEKGKRVKKLEGKTYQIMLNDQSKALAAKEQKGGRFNLQARVYADDGVIEVVSFKPATK